MFVHLASDDTMKRIRRGGIRGQKVWTIDGQHARVEVSDAVYCMPVVPNFSSTHQWVRELRRRGKRTMQGAYFRLPGSTLVWVGRYNEPHELVTARAAAARLMRLNNAEGFEVILPRSVSAAEIHAVGDLPRNVGWRYFPGAHSRGIFCRCESCNKGGFKARRLIVGDETSPNRLSREIAERLKKSGRYDAAAVTKEWKSARRAVRRKRQGKISIASPKE